MRMIVPLGLTIVACWSGLADSQALPTAPAVTTQCAAATRQEGTSNTDALLVRGRCLLEDQREPRDTTEARQVLGRAATQGSADAAIMLGKTYWNGDGIAKDNAAAAKWWRVAYRTKHPEAAFLLGQEAFVRLMRNAKSPREADPSTLRDAISFFDTASKSDPSPAARAQAIAHMSQLREFQRELGR